MPIQYRFESIMDFMSFEQKTAFVAAAKDIYGFDLTIEPPFLKGTVHHGKSLFVMLVGFRFFFCGWQQLTFSHALFYHARYP